MSEPRNRLQIGKLRFTVCGNIQGFKWWKKWFDLSILPYFHLHCSRGNRAHLEPNTVAFIFGWIIWGASLWITWPYHDKYCDISYRDVKV